MLLLLLSLTSIKWVLFNCYRSWEVLTLSFALMVAWCGSVYPVLRSTASDPPPPIQKQWRLASVFCTPWLLAFSTCFEMVSSFGFHSNWLFSFFYFSHQYFSVFLSDRLSPRFHLQPFSFCIFFFIYLILSNDFYTRFYADGNHISWFVFWVPNSQLLLHWNILEASHKLLIFTYCDVQFYVSAWLGYNTQIFGQILV